MDETTEKTDADETATGPNVDKMPQKSRTNVDKMPQKSRTNELSTASKMEEMTEQNGTSESTPDDADTDPPKLKIAPEATVHSDLEVGARGETNNVHSTTESDPNVSATAPGPKSNKMDAEMSTAARLLPLLKVMLSL